MKTAVISGIAGQDACWMTEILINDGYKVYGTIRPSTSPNFWRLKEHGLLDDKNLEIVPNDITDCSNVFDLISKIKPDLFINLAAISSVGQSFDTPIIVAQTDAMGPLYCLEAIRQNSKKTKFYTAGSSEMIGNTKNINGAADEFTPMLPESPYAAAKTFAHNLVRIYRKSYNIFACSSILFNHGSKYRGEYFIERKIGKYVAALKMQCVNANTPLILGNLNASRDIGHAKDYMLGVYLSLLQKTPDDYVFATGKTYTIKEMLKIAFDHIGENWKEYVVQDKNLLRPSEVHVLLGDASKARDKLKWNPVYSFENIMQEIIEADIDRFSKKVVLSGI